MILLLKGIFFLAQFLASHNPKGKKSWKGSGKLKKRTRLRENKAREIFGKKEKENEIIRTIERRGDVIFVTDEDKTHDGWCSLLWWLRWGGTSHRHPL